MMFLSVGLFGFGLNKVIKSLPINVSRLVEFGNGEWKTRVTVAREGSFTRSKIEEVDEAEIFEGAENTLTLNQTYTHEFQCQYKLQRYPFDSQVRSS